MIINISCDVYGSCARQRELLSQLHQELICLIWKLYVSFDYKTYYDITCKCIKRVTPDFLAFFCYFYGENTSYNKVLWCFWPFVSNLWSCIVLNDELYLHISDFIHANEQTEYANCGLHLKFWNFLWKSLFYDAKGSFSAKVVTLVTSPL